VSAQVHRLLVTGGAGFIGSNFIRQQQLESNSGEAPVALLVCLDKLTYAGNRANLIEVEKDPAFVFVEGDVGDSVQVASLLERHRITGVIHFAAESHVDRSIDSPEIFVQTNVLGTLRLLEAARQYWNHLAAAEKAAFRFVAVSTDEVFGSLQAKEAAFTEQTPLSPNSPYAASKAGGDHLARAYFHTYGFPVITSNCSNNYGPYQFPEKLIPLMILNALEQKALPVYGDGGQIRDWLYVADHCRALRLILDKGEPGETYMIGGMNEIPNLELVRQICAVLDDFRPRAEHRSYGELISFVPDRPGHDRRYAVNCQKIKRELGWQPRENFTSGLRETIGWYLAHRDWCDEIQSKKYRQERLGLAPSSPHLPAADPSTSSG
jgi:dTDP-glucose 4,6-dehydratase